jgi:phthalate 4,5-cis-dihydrodiol dehydrogenase
MTNRLGVGIVGLGMAGGFMVPVISAHAKVKLVAAADPDPILRERFSQSTGLPAFESAEGLFRRQEVEVAYIATPHQFHCGQSIDAMRAGKHVVVEKPMALALSDCDAMNEVADATGMTLIVGHTHGFDPAPRAIGEIVASGRYGPLSMLITLNYTNFMYRPRRPEELVTAKGGGIFYNQLPHQIEVARVVAGKPVRSVRCVAGSTDPQRPTEGHLTALVVFDGGAAASITYSGHDRFDSDELHFGVDEVGYPKKAAHGATWRAFRRLTTPAAESDARRDRYGYGSMAFRELASPPHQPHFGYLLASLARADVRATADGLSIYDVDGLHAITLPAPDGFAGHANVWYDCSDAIRGVKPALHDGHFARDTVRICEALLKSSRDEREIVIS